jgi:hypothetical protein
MGSSCHVAACSVELLWECAGTFPDMSSSKLQAIRYTRGSLELLDQRALPTTTTYVQVASLRDCHAAIKDMLVRGAPAIAITAALALANDIQSIKLGSGEAAAGASAPSSASPSRLAYHSAQLSLPHVMQPT